MPQPRESHTVWLFALGYFAAYVPYSALTKAVSSGLLGDPIAGVELLPITAVASLVGMFVFITAMRWWRFASSSRIGRFTVPRPTRITLLSGICTSAVIATTTLAYTFDGVSIVFMMLLMRGGVLIIAPIVDAMSGRRVRWFSAVGLALSLGSVVVAAASAGRDLAVTWVAAVDVAVYLGAYFLRLRWMSRTAKTSDLAQRTRYFVEEQMVATPVLVIVLAIGAAIGQGEVLGDLRAGFTTFLGRPIVWVGVVIGLLSQGTGIFGGLVLLDHRESSFAVPINRCASVLAGVLAGYVLVWCFGASPPAGSELVGAGLIVLALAALATPLLARFRSPSSPTAARARRP